MDKAQLETLLGRIDVWLLIFGVVVVVGVAGESFFGIRHWWNSRKLQAIQHIEDEQREEKIAQLNKESGSFQLQIAQANERAANAERSAAESRLALEKIRLPRRLTKEQRARITDKMHVFAGTQFDAALNTGQETQEFLIEIEDALRSAGWMQVDWSNDFEDVIFSRTGRPKAGVSSHSGVVIEVHKENAANFQPIAQALMDALNGEGVATEVKYVGTFKNNNPKAVHIIVGEKPK
jgi:hypothetical protein